MPKIPELLLPAGNVENFRAAIDGGADAIYLGLRKFNARGRATNFTYSQFISLLNEAEKSKVKVYVTVNTVIKNNEIPELLDTLWFLSKTKVSAVIIQDWGVYYLLKKYFPKLVIHASTQMGNHNSAGANYSKYLGFERVILARELTEKEIDDISKRTQIELEIFTHGALCYSFSGICLFSSYLGGAGANRGICAQPCRRSFNNTKKNKPKYIFSLKDNQLIDNLPEITNMGVASVKVEGRMKSAEYVYNVAQAYRKALDNKRNIVDARKDLQLDFGREKTAYFFGGNVSKAITINPNTGIYIGSVIKRNDNFVTIESNRILEEGNRIRFFSIKTEEQTNIKLKSLKAKGNNLYEITYDTSEISKNDKVFLIGLKSTRYSNKTTSVDNIPSQEMPNFDKQKILKKFNLIKPKQKQVFVRIDSIKWMRKIWFDSFDNLILNLTTTELNEFNPLLPFIKKNINSIYIELPKFIPENKVEFYKSICQKLYKNGIKNFMISHLSQKEFIPKGANVSTNENVYVFNDAASKLLREQGVKYFSYPQENDFGNLYSIKNRSGIVPVYFYPNLFYSRMPVKIDNTEEVFTDDTNKTFKRTIREGVTIISPENAVSIIQQKYKLEKLGYSNFLIDFSLISPSKNIFNKVIKHFNAGQAIAGTTTFNFKRELK